jgi:predicted permease
LGEVVKQAFESVLTLFLLGLAGFYVSRRGWVNDAVREFLPRLVVGCTLPLYLFSTAFKILGRDSIPGLVKGAALSGLTIAATMILALAASRILKVRRGRRGVFVAGFSFSNTMFLGLPINVALFGDSAMPFVIAYFFANSLFFWAVGDPLLGMDGPDGPSRMPVLERLKKFFNPPLACFMLAMALIVLGVPVPDFLMDSAGLIGATTTPLALMYIGMGLANLDLRLIRPEKDLIGVLSGRFVFCPLVTMLLCLAFGPPVGMSQVFLIQSSLPVLALSSIMAAYHKADAQFAILIVSLSTMLSLITVPIFRILVTVF